MSDTKGQPNISLILQSQARYLSSVRAMISTLAERLGFDDLQCGQITLAVDEALCNIINHGYERQPNGLIWINLWELDGETPGIRIVIEDRAKQVDPDEIRSRRLDDVRPGGLGVHIIREVMDEVSYERRNDEGMRLTLVKRFQPSHPPSEMPESQGKVAHEKR